MNLRDSDGHRLKGYTLIPRLRGMGNPEAAGEAHATAAPQRKTILYFYHNCGFPHWQPSYNIYEYRILEILCKNHDVIVAVFWRSWSRWPQKEIIPGNAKLLLLPDLPLPKGFPRVLGWILETATRIIRIAVLVRSIRPDLIYANWLPWESGFCCARAGVHPLVVAAWGTDILIMPKKSRILRLFAELTVRSADAIVLSSETMREAAFGLGCAPSKICCFPWGIDLRKFRRQDRAPVRRQLHWTNNEVVISTRHHDILYGVEYLIRALPRILESHRDARLLIVGGGPLLDYHKSLVRHLGIQEEVRFLGYVENDQMPKILNAADVYVSTSFSDGCSGSLMEALGCGLPVVVTDIPANREWINDGQNGFLVPTADPSSLAACVAKLLRDDELRLRMSRANLSLASMRADWEKNALVLEKCVDDLIDAWKK